MMAIDGADSTTLRGRRWKSPSRSRKSTGRTRAKAFEAAGGYSPTVGIIGAVLGLIHVMSNLSDIAAVGEGIAGAFVATIYGVAVANIIFLPLGGRIKLRLREEITMKEMMLVGVLAIQEGMNPKLVRERLTEFVHSPAGEEAGRRPEAARANLADCAMRKKKHPEHVNHERWLVSYADFITLLFAFFVVMFAVSQVDSKRMGRFTEAFSKAVGEEIFPGKGDTIIPVVADLQASDKGEGGRAARGAEEGAQRRSRSSRRRATRSRGWSSCSAVTSWCCASPTTCSSRAETTR